VESVLKNYANSSPERFAYSNVRDRGLPR